MTADLDRLVVSGMSAPARPGLRRIVVVGIGVGLAVLAVVGPHPKVLAIGDSLVSSVYASSPEQRWTALVGAAADGRIGFTSADALNAHWPTAGASTILVVLGTNDYLRGIPAATFGANLRTLVGRLPGRVILVAAPDPLDDRAAIEPWADYVAQMRAIGPTIQIPPLRADQLEDGIHPNDAGEAVWAAAVRTTPSSPDRSPR